jgi:hypothetical protein
MLYRDRRSNNSAHPSISSFTFLLVLENHLIEVVKRRIIHQCKRIAYLVNTLPDMLASARLRKAGQGVGSRLALSALGPFEHHTHLEGEQ